MAVTTTPRDIIDAAYPRSKKNKPGLNAAESTELRLLVGRALRSIYTAAARVNRFFFADEQQVAYQAPGWARPENAESIIGIRKTTGAPVITVDPLDRNMEPDLAAVYEIGQIFRAPGNPQDPTPADSLVFVFAKAADIPASLTATLDPTWVERFNDLLIDEVAIYLAMKDIENQRQAEATMLRQDRDAKLAQFFAFLEHATPDVRKRFDHYNIINNAQMIPITSLFAGGTSVQLPS